MTPIARLAPRAVPAALGALLLTGLIALAATLPDVSHGQGRTATLTLLSRSLDGGAPNGPSTNPVISGDLRYSQIIAFESEASDLVTGDSNGVRDVFAIRRAGSFGDLGTEWEPGRTQLVSRGRKGPANGPSFDPSTDGNAKNRARCVAFLSDASNLVSATPTSRPTPFSRRHPGSRRSAFRCPPTGSRAPTRLRSRSPVTARASRS